MPALFATCLLLSLVFAAAVAFSSWRGRRVLKWLLALALAVAWVSLGLALAQIVARTASTLVTPGGARQPHLVAQAGHEALLLLASLGGPALLCTLLGWLALKATRGQRREAGHHQPPPG